MERPPEPKKGEHRPLLKVEIGMPETLHQPAASPPNWSVTCMPKKAWIQRWPDLVTASWMTLTLLVMSFLLLYALGMATYARKPLILKYSDSRKPSSNVFLHHIINKGCRIPLEVYTHYVELMSLSYPNLHFNIFFLVDDTIRHPYYVPRHGRLSGRWLTYPNKDVYVKHSCIKEFERKHPNINITIMALNKYMAMTPLRFKWRTIPVSYVSFYARVFSVWQNGGIGIDFTTYSSNMIRKDQRIHEILKNHNDGLPIPDYNIILEAIDDEEENSFKYLKQILNDTLSMFNSVFSLGLPSPTEVLPSNDTMITKSQRSKRNVGYDFYNILTSENTTSTVEKMSDTLLNVTTEDKTINLKEANTKQELPDIDVSKTTTESAKLASSQAMTEVDKVSEVNLIPAENNKSNNIPEGPQAVLFYDFSIMSDKIGNFLLREPLWPTFMFSGSNIKNEAVEDDNKKNKTKTAAQLALTPDGVFIAATDRMHPFLGMLIPAGLQRMRPDFAIRDTLITQCSGAYENQPHCSIYNI